MNAAAKTIGAAAAPTRRRHASNRCSAGESRSNGGGGGGGSSASTGVGIIGAESTAATPALEIRANRPIIDKAAGRPRADR